MWAFWRFPFAFQGFSLHKLGFPRVTPSPIDVPKDFPNLLSGYDQFEILCICTLFCGGCNQLMIRIGWLVLPIPILNSFLLLLMMEALGCAPPFGNSKQSQTMVATLQPLLHVQVLVVPSIAPRPPASTLLRVCGTLCGTWACGHLALPSCQPYPCLRQRSTTWQWHVTGRSTQGERCPSRVRTAMINDPLVVHNFSSVLSVGS